MKTAYHTTTEYRTHWIDAAGRRYEQRHPFRTGLLPVINLDEVQGWIDLSPDSDHRVFYARQFLRADQHPMEQDRLAPLIADELTDEVPRYYDGAPYIAMRERWPIPELGGGAASELRNLTPHAVTIREVTIPPSGTIARATEDSMAAEPLYILRSIPDPQGQPTEVGGATSRPGYYAGPDQDVREVPTSTTRYTGLVDLPDPQPGVYLIVSLVVAQTARSLGRWTGDLLTPGQQVRDSAGRVIGCRSLDRVMP